MVFANPSTHWITMIFTIHHPQPTFGNLVGIGHLTNRIRPQDMLKLDHLPRWRVNIKIVWNSIVNFLWKNQINIWEIYELNIRKKQIYQMNKTSDSLSFLFIFFCQMFLVGLFFTCPFSYRVPGLGGTIWDLFFFKCTSWTIQLVFSFKSSISRNKWRPKAPNL